MSKNASTKGILWGMIGGFAGTIIMDLVIVVFFSLAGMPTSLIYSFIGEVAESFFLRLGMHFSGGIFLGASIHFFLGLVLGGLFGWAVSQIKAFHIDSIGRGILIGILYIEIASQPILIMAPFFKEMTSSDILQWYGLSTVMHMIYGAILGGILSYKHKEIISTSNTARS